MSASRTLLRAASLAVCATFATSAVVRAATPIEATRAPQNPFMAANPGGNIHNDTWMTDAYQYAGPLGRNLQTRTGIYPPSLCGSLAFDKGGRIISTCPSSGAAPQIRVFDPETLAILATHNLPDAPNPPGTTFFQNFTGGGYFFLDAQDRIWSATKTNHLVVIAVRDSGRSLIQVADYDLSGVLSADQRISSALPDWRGRIWFVSKQDGLVGVLDTATRKIRTTTLHEQIENSFAVDRAGLYIASDKRMYRFNAGADNRPVVDWKLRYKNSGIHKPGQVDAGTGTTPTVFNHGRYVTITDNADPMNVVVYRTAKRLRRGVRRVVCETPVFAKGASATENSIIAAGDSLFVENNYGYQDPFGPSADAPTTAGFARVDAGRGGCRVRWTNRTAPVPSVVSKLSTRTGLIYTYIADGTPRAWYWAAVDAHTGKEAWRRLAGTGAAFNNNYAGLAIGRNGTAYLGTFGGLQALRDR